MRKLLLKENCKVERMLTTSKHLRHFKVHHGDAQEFGGLLEDGVLGEGGRVPVSVGVAEAPHAGPVVQLAGIPVLLQALHTLVHLLGQQVLDVSVPEEGNIQKPKKRKKDPKSR